VQVSDLPAGVEAVGCRRAPLHNRRSPRTRTRRGAGETGKEKQDDDSEKKQAGAAKEEEGQDERKEERRAHDAGEEAHTSTPHQPMQGVQAEMARRREENEMVRRELEEERVTRRRE